MDWNARIVNQVTGDDQATYNAIMNAVQAYDSDIINNSWALCQPGTCLNAVPTPRYSTLVRRAFANAYKLNVVTAAAMGNYNTSNTYYPAGFGQGIIAVGATDRNDVRWVNSNYGSHIDVVAPGVSIYSTATGSPGYVSLTGTSMATPHISGIAGLMLAINPNLYNDDIEQIIRYSAEDRGVPGIDNLYGTGRVNARRALDLLRSPYAVSHRSSTGGTIVSSTGTYSTTIYDAPGLAPDVYVVKRHEVRKTVSFPSTLEVKVWGRGVASKGWNIESPNFSLPWVGVVAGTVTSTGATLRTYVYEVWAQSGQFLGWYPTTASGTVFAYTVHGKPTTSAPLAPTGVTVTNSGSVGAHPILAWNASSGATGYDVYRCSNGTSSCTNYQFIGSTSSTSYTDTGRIISSNCMGIIFYHVVAKNSAGFSPPSSSASVCGGAAFADALTKASAVALPEEYALGQSAPNPFSHSTDIRYDLPEPAHVRLAVYNLLGQEVRRLVDGEVGAGFHTVTFEAGDLPSGVYLYRITAGDFTQTHRMVLTK